jgi:uncharacterized membrane protein YphA (DoxX/SURF4 family)
MKTNSNSSSSFLSWAALVARVLVGGLFLLTGIAKIIGLERFVEEVRKYDLLPLAATNPVAYFVPWLEVAAGGLLVFGLWRREARIIIAAMLVVFTVAKVYAYARGLNIECGCGGGLVFLKYIFDLPQGILTNLGLLGLLCLDACAQHRAEPGGAQPLEALWGMGRHAPR